MITETVKDYAAMSSVGASIIYDAVMRKLAKGERFNLGLATGNTMITLYDELADKFNRARADLSLLSTWNLDEYASDAHTAVPHDHPLSYWKYMHEMLFAKFNEPMREDEISVEAFGALPTRVLPLSKETIEQNTAVTAGGDASLVPRYAATMGMAPILAAKKCLLLACFKEQTAPLKAIFARGGEPTPFLPASYLWRHHDYHLIYTTDKIAIESE